MQVRDASVNTTLTNVFSESQPMLLTAAATLVWKSDGSGM
jgi:hypothetical protein